MEIPIHGNGDSRRLPEDDGLEQVSWEVGVKGGQADMWGWSIWTAQGPCVGD